jgi:DNA-binding MarR family transcriptional regulator
VTISNLESHLGYWLRAVSNAVSYNFARKVEAEGVTVAEWVLMRVLYDTNGLPPTMLADRLGMTKGAVTKLADRLIEKKLVQRKANPDDRRAQTLALLQPAGVMVPRLAALADQNDAEFFGALTAGEREELNRLMRKIVASRALTGIPTD